MKDAESRRACHSTTGNSVVFQICVDHTIDGRNPAPSRMYKTLEIVG